MKLFAALVCALVLCGCSPEQSSPPPATTVAPEPPADASIAFKLIGDAQKGVVTFACQKSNSGVCVFSFRVARGMAIADQTLAVGAEQTVPIQDGTIYCFSTKPDIDWTACSRQTVSAGIGLTTVSSSSTVK